MCDGDNVKKLYQGFALGQSYSTVKDSIMTVDADGKATIVATTKCLEQATSWAKKAQAMYATVSGTSLSSYTGTTLNTLLSSYNELTMLNADLNAECETINKIKQFSQRTTKLSGFFNALFTGGYSAFKSKNF